MNRQPLRSARVDLATGEVTALRAELVSTKRVPAGQAVSYGGEYVTDAPTTLGLVGLGYADGIPRSAMGAPVTIGGRQYAIAGRVAMDQLVVDLGNDDVPQAGAPVVFWNSSEQRAAFAASARVPDAMLASFIGARVRVELTSTVPGSDAMEALGARFAAVLHAGDGVVLTGELGAGKTTFTRGLGRALGARGTVQSPTFVIARTHETDTVPLLHVDAYRLGDEALIDDLDLDLAGSITVAEWGAPLTRSMPAWFDVRIERASGAAADPLDEEADDPREVVITTGGGLASSRLVQLLRQSEA